MLRQDLCGKCGRGYTLMGDYFPRHNVIKPNGTRSSVECRGSGEYSAPPRPVEVQKIKK